MQCVSYSYLSWTRIHYLKNSILVKNLMHYQELFDIIITGYRLDNASDISLFKNV